jgi:hypothetical protein
MLGINPTVLRTILTVSGLNAQIKRQMLPERVKKQTMCCLQEVHFIHKDTYRLTK